MNISTKEIFCKLDRNVPESHIRELAASYMENGGWIQPIGIRAESGLPDGKTYKVVWGKCRFAAMLLNGMDTIDDENGDFRLVTSDTSDEQLAFLENFQRRQMTVEEEINLLDRSLKSSPFTTISCLEKLLGKSRKWIRTRLRIREAAALLQKELETAARNFDGINVPNHVCDSVSSFCLPLILRYGYYGNIYTPIKEFLRGAVTEKWKKLGSYLIRQMAEDVGNQVKYTSLSSLEESYFTDLSDHAGIEWKELMKQAEENIPVPDKLRKELEKADK